MQVGATTAAFTAIGLLLGYSWQISLACSMALALSMATTPFLMLLNDRYIIPRFMSRLPERAYDAVHDDGSSVIIAGYGRFGQIIGRFLRAQKVPVTILEKDPDQVEQVRRFGAQAYFGDASRIDLLRAAGAHKAKVLVIAIDDADKTLDIVRLAKKEFPNLKLFARARNRRHAYELDKAGVDYFRREMFDASLVMAQEVMKLLGGRAQQVQAKAEEFMRHDEKTLFSSFAFFEREPELISFSQQATHELERILLADSGDNVAPLQPDAKTA